MKSRLGETLVGFRNLVVFAGVLGLALTLPVHNGRGAETQPEPLRASLCDLWPLAVGNQWLWVSPLWPIPDSPTVSLVVTDAFVVHGFQVWQTQTEVQQFGPTFTGYLVFADGWLRFTKELTDLDALPTVAPGMKRVLPETLVSGESVETESGALFGMPDSPVTLLFWKSGYDSWGFVQPGSGFFELERGVGPRSIVGG